MNQRVSDPYYGEEHTKPFQKLGPGNAEKSKDKEIFLAQVGVIPTQRSQLGADSSRGMGRRSDTGQDHQQDPTKEKVALMHIGKKEGDPKAEGGPCQGKGRFVRRLSADKNQRQNQEHEEKRT